MITDNEQYISKMSEEEREEIKRINKKIGKYCFWVPFFILIFVLFIFTITIYSINPMVEAGSVPGESRSYNLELIAIILRRLLGILGLSSFLGIITGILILIVTFKNKNIFPDLTFDNRSGKGKDSTIPEEIKGWNWGAAGLFWIWGASNRVWISLLSFVPIINFVFWIYLGMKGSELAWRAKKWESVAKFNEIQNEWKPWGVLFFMSIIFILVVKFLD
ncbi:MAG TPA: hypothetical protein P5230_01540 [Candidatus Magasanikbacteria bacterium]|nr:hypothetical protein [Candidatus Magasanikbacteria bacterium]